MSRRAAIYARVSTLDQNPENQVEVLKEFAERHGYEIYDIYVDKISGIKSSRPELQRLLLDAHDKKFDVVLVWKLDRLGRSLQHLIKIVECFRKWGIDFISTTQNIDTTTPSGKLTFHILAALSEFERSLISERTKLGLQRARKRGKKLGRPKGSKDKKPRRKSGYYLRYQKQKMGQFFTTTNL